MPSKAADSTDPAATPSRPDEGDNTTSSPIKSNLNSSSSSKQTSNGKLNPSSTNSVPSSTDKKLGSTSGKMSSSLAGSLSSVAPIGVGFLFGFALDRGLVNNPEVIRSQFNFSNFTMLRMFLSASITSTITVSMMHALKIKRRSPCPGLTLWSTDTYGANLLGGLLLGSGMALTGSCPGTVYSQIGAFGINLDHFGKSFEMLRDRGVVVLGGITGALLFGYTKDNLVTYFESIWMHRSNPQDCCEQTMNKMSVAFVGFAGAVVYMLNQPNFFPWRGQAEIYAYNSWDPALAGILIGLLQIPCNIFIGVGLGASSGWVYYAQYLASLFDKNLAKNSPYLFAAKSSDKVRWQVLQGLGAILGGYYSHNVFMGGIRDVIGSGVQSSGLGLIGDFIGGMLLLFGARMAGGCTSGHGLTGIANMGFSSFIAVTAMFAGGIATRFLMDFI